MTEPPTRPPLPVNPCLPDPCGPFSQCRNQGGIAACSCLPGYIGVPPNCRPECVLHSECPSNLACIGEKCRDPCPGACGPAAECEVINHNAVCRCQQGYEGDPFTGCRRITTREYSTIILYSSLGMQIQLQLVYQHHPSEIPKMNSKSINGCNHGNIYRYLYIYIFQNDKVHFEKYLRYIVYGTYMSYISL